ncbi:MAG: hypothetical protein FWE00_06655 [Defluviitaleaceae bacterium]|nr:hypothetical protein [Defluviitaleaceae bacterium]
MLAIKAIRAKIPPIISGKYKLGMFAKLIMKMSITKDMKAAAIEPITVNKMPMAFVKYPGFTLFLISPGNMVIRLSKPP